MYRYFLVTKNVVEKDNFCNRRSSRLHLGCSIIKIWHVEVEAGTSGFEFHSLNVKTSRPEGGRGAT